MKKFLNFAVLGIIAGSLAVVSCTQEVKTSDFENLKTEVENLKNQLKASEVDLKTQLNTLQFVLQSYKDEVNPQLAQLSEDLKADYDILAAADVILAQQLEEAQNTLQAAIDENSKDIAANKKALQDAIAEYKKLVADAVKDFQAALEKAQKDQAAIDNAQDEALDILAAEIATYEAATDEALETLDATIEEMAAALEGVEGSVEDLEAAMEELTEKVDANFAAAIAYTDALEASVNATIEALAERVAANEEAIKKLNEETIPEIEEAIVALQEAALDLEGNVDALEEKKLDKETFQDFLTTYAEWQGTVDNSITSINGSIKYLQMLYESMDGQIKSINTTLDVLNGDENIKGSVKQQIKALHEDVIKHLNELKEELKGEIDGLKAELDAVKEDIKTIQADITVIKGLIQANTTEIGKLDARITSNEGDIAALKTAKADLEKDIKALETALADKETELKGLISDLDAKIAIINGEADTEGSIKYAVAQLNQSIMTEIGKLSGRIDKNEADIAELQEEIGKLQKRIQSLTFVPQYQDLKFGIPFTKIGGTYEAFNTVQGFPVVYKVTPVELAKPIAKAINDAIAAGTTPVFTFDIESSLKTRAGDNDPMLIIKEAVGDEATGKITLYLAHKNFNPEGGKLDKYAISLRADNDEFKVHVASEYVQATLHQKAELQVQTDKLYKPNVTTGEAGESIVINNDPGVVEGNLSLSYTDGETHSYFDGYEMAAKDVTTGTIRTFSQWKSMGYDMPTVTTTVTPQLDPATSTDNIVANTAAKPVTFAVKIMNGLKDNMVVTKKAIGKTNRYNYAFSDGTNTINAQLDVTIGKHTGTFQVNIPFTMTWTYALINDPSTNSDDEVDHANKNVVDPASWKEYHRGTDASEETFVVTPTLTVDGQDLVLDGSNKVYGLTVEDFAGKVFTPSVASPFPGEITYDFNVANQNVDKKTISLTRFDVKGVRLGKTYTCAGSYNLDAYTTENVKAAFTITTVDRKTDVIKITAPAVNVKLLGDEYDKNLDRYAITSDDFAQALVDAYIAQGILPAGTGKAHAFATNEEFGEINIVDDGSSVLDNKFTYDVVYTSSNEAFKIKSKTSGADLLKSSDLHLIATGSDCKGEENPWALTVETYVGQKIQITWPISVAPKFDYKFVTYGITTADNSYQVKVDWIGAPTAITKAQTELDLVKDNDNIKVMYFNGTSENYIAYGDYAKDDFKLVPRFSLVEDKDGIDVVNSGTAALNCVSKVTYYGQVASVGIKSALYVKSGDTEFYVPGSDKMYVNGTPVSSVTVKQANPIAAEQPAVTAITNIPTTPIVMLTMKDSEGFSIYADGAAQKDHAPYATGKTMKDIFNSIIFSIYSVNGSTSIAGWALEGANEFGTVDTPTTVQLKTSGVAKGTYTVVLKAKTAWKDYFYTVTVNNQ